MACESVTYKLQCFSSVCGWEFTEPSLLLSSLPPLCVDVCRDQFLPRRHLLQVPFSLTFILVCGYNRVISIFPPSFNLVGKVRSGVKFYNGCWETGL